MNRGRNVARSRYPRDLFPKIFLEATRIDDHGVRMRLLHEMFEFLFAGYQGSHWPDGESPRLGCHGPMLEWPFFLHPLHPPAVENSQARVSKIFQHPEHATFVSPVVKWIGIDDHLAVLTDA